MDVGAELHLSPKFGFSTFVLSFSTFLTSFSTLHFTSSSTTSTVSTLDFGQLSNSFAGGDVADVPVVVATTPEEGA